MQWQKKYFDEQLMNMSSSAALEENLTESRIYDKQNGLWYELQGDYYIPCLTLPTEENQPICIWGQRHARYLKEHCKVLSVNLLTSRKLNSRLAEIDKQAEDMFLRLVKEMAEREGVRDRTTQNN